MLSHPRTRARCGIAAFEADRRATDAGFVLVMQVLLLGVMMTMTTLAVDVGSFYNHAAEVQKAADAAALAAVVWMPDDFTKHDDRTTRRAASRNGFVHGVNGVTVNVLTVTGNERRVRVVITDPNVPTIFGKLITDKISITRDSIAEYVLSVSLGSPLSTFGNTALGASSPNFWATINGPYTAKAQGDPYATRCNNSFLPPRARARTASPRVWVPSTRSMCQPDLRDDRSRWRFSMRRSTIVETSVRRPATSNGSTAGYRSPTSSSKPTAHRLTTPTTPRSLAGALNRAGAPERTRRVQEEPPIPGRRCAPSRWCARARTCYASLHNHRFHLGDRLCDGELLSEIVVVGYLALATGVRPWRHVDRHPSGRRTTFYLAEVPALHAGKTFEVELFDPGDGASGTYDLEILKPDGTTANCRLHEHRGCLRIHRLVQDPHS